MMRDDWERLGLSIARASWLLGVTVPRYRELEDGEDYPGFQWWDRIRKLYGWPQTVRGGRPRTVISADQRLAGSSQPP
jgi:Helix-turn-helix domain